MFMPLFPSAANSLPDEPGLYAIFLPTAATTDMPSVICMPSGESAFCTSPTSAYRQEETLSVASEAVLLLALAHNVFSDMPLSEISASKYALLDYVRAACPGSLRAIESTGDLNPEEISTLKKAMDAFLEERNAG